MLEEQSDDGRQAMTTTPDPTAVVQVEDHRYHLRKAAAQDLVALASALADAFYDDPIFCWLLPRDATRRKRLKRFYAIELRQVALKRGHAWTSEELAGAAIIAPPAAWRVPPRAMLAQARLFGRGLPKAARLLAAVEARHLREPHYYFAHIGVTGTAQGRGLGASLMRPTLDRCDMEGLPAYLEATSERSAALYERLGFEIIGEMSTAGSPLLRLMRRDPQHPSHSASLNGWVLLTSDSTQGGPHG
jgi:GNAT superfamily N-acetyltransferase